MNRHSEILIKVMPRQSLGVGYQDQDVVIIFTGRMIRYYHALRICDHRNAATNIATGLRIPGTIAEDFFRRTHRYLLERIGVNAVQRTDLVGGDIKVITPIPDKDGEFLHADKFVENRRAKKGHRLFGNVGSEFWYGGEKDFSDAKLDLVWSDIESKTTNLEDDNRSYPFSVVEMKTDLVLPIEDLSDVEAANMTQPEWDDSTDVLNRKQTRKRDSFVEYETLGLPVTNRDIQDRSKKIDLRKMSPLSKIDTVKTKPRRSVIPTTN